jgi:hypothetical protein
MRKLFAVLLLVFCGGCAATNYGGLDWAKHMDAQQKNLIQKERADNANN